MILLSIIIPIYNSENYILDCLLSLKDQLNDLTELILIDDGSTDSSLKIIENFKIQIEEDLQVQIKIISQKNQGVSAARNMGILSASGQYISFIDADDYVAHNYVSSIINATSQKPDIISFNALYYFDNQPEKNTLLDNHDITAGYHLMDKQTQKSIFIKNQWFSWLRVYKKAILGHTLFPQQLSHFEDAFFLSMLLLRSQSLFKIEDALYFYRIQPDSATRTTNKEVKRKLLTSASQLLDHFLQHIQQYPLLAIPLLHFFNIYIEESKQSFGKQEAKQNWNSYAPKIYNQNISPSMILSDRERMLLYFLRYGLWGHYASKKVYKLYCLLHKK